MRPPGYEPGELPTAPLRDFIKLNEPCFSFAGAKVRKKNEINKFFLLLFLLQTIKFINCQLLESAPHALLSLLVCQQIFVQ